MKRFLTLIPILGFALAPLAKGAVIHTGALDIALPQSFVSGIYINLSTSATTTTYPTDFDTAPWIGFDFGGVGISNGDAVRPVLASTQVVRLTIADSVGSSSNLASAANYSDNHTGAAVSQFQIGTAGYFGFGFSPTVGAPTQYGWAKITIDNVGTGTLHEWAYESVPGASIQVGVPEPATLGFSVIALGLCLRRRR